MELDGKAGRKANALTWVGLGLMSVQFGVLARLTWWEYSWDVSIETMASRVDETTLILRFPTDYGTGHVLCHLRHGYGCVRLLRVDETSENSHADRQ